MKKAESPHRPLRCRTSVQKAGPERTQRIEQALHGLVEQLVRLELDHQREGQETKVPKMGENPHEAQESISRTEPSGLVLGDAAP